MVKAYRSRRLLKKVQMQGGARCGARGVLGTYAAAPHERSNAADGPFSAACQQAAYSRRISSGPFTASMIWVTGSSFSSSVVMARRYFRMWVKNFL